MYNIIEERTDGADGNWSEGKATYRRGWYQQASALLTDDGTVCCLSMTTVTATAAAVSLQLGSHFVK